MSKRLCPMVVMWCIPEVSGFWARMAMRVESVLKRTRPPEGCWARLQTGVRNESLSRSGKRRNAGLSRSEEHTSELQSPCNLVCRLLLEKKKKKSINTLTKNSCD